MNMGLENPAFHKNSRSQEYNISSLPSTACTCLMCVAVTVVKDFFQSLQMLCSEVLWILLLLS